MFVLCMSGGVYWCFAFYSAIKSSTSFECFIIKAVYFWSVPLDLEVLIDFVLCREMLGSVARLDGVGFDEVGIDTIEKHNVVVAFVGYNGKTSLGLSNGHEYHVDFVVL